MLDVPRLVSGVEERRQDVHVVGVLQDMRPQLEARRRAVQRADDGYTVSALGVKLDLVQRADIRSADVQPRDDEHDGLVDVGEV